MRYNWILLFLLVGTAYMAAANPGGKTGDVPSDISRSGNGGIVVTDSAATVSKGNLYERVKRYFSESNKPKKNKKFDFSVIGGPYYMSDTKFGIGLVAAGLYRTSEQDTMLVPSDVSLYGKATTSMHFELGISGNHIFPGDSKRLIYDISFASINTKFWGIGYDSDINDNNESDYRYLHPKAEINFLWKAIKGLYLGPTATFDYIKGRDFDKPYLWEGQDSKTLNVGIGITVQYDRRDHITNAYTGFYVMFGQRFYPRFLFNDYAFSQTAFDVSWYHPTWKGCVFATRFSSRFTYGNTPWGLLPTFGGSTNMRGYFKGRFRDKCEMDVCLELRQHVWHRCGVVAWIGAGTVFPRFKDMRWRKILPNYGFGYRWEFKQRVNVRLDLGFGRHQTGFVFSINEAF